MTFQNISLKNFGQFRGPHNIPLVVGPDQPILLIGGYNGEGKTTVLDAMKLCLYGKRADCYKRSSKRWDNYLSDWINRHSQPQEGALIQLSFTHPHCGNVEKFRIDFSWRSTGKGLVEKREVFLGGKYDSLVSATWDKVVDTILPARLATLFFFDGEQIETLVHAVTARTFLKSASYELLGIGIIEQLVSDLSTLSRNISLDSKTGAQKVAYEAADSEYGDMLGQKKETEEQLAALKFKLLKEQRVLESVDSEFKAKGGDFLEEQISNEVLKTELEKQNQDIRSRINKLHTGVLPLHLMKNELEEIKAQIEKEQVAKDFIQGKKQLKSFHTKYYDTAERNGASPKVLEALSNLVDSEKRRIDKGLENVEIFLDFPSESMSILESALLDIPKVVEEKELLDRQETEIIERVHEVTARIEAIPEIDVLEPTLSKRRESLLRISDIEYRIGLLEVERQQLQNKTDQLKEKVTKLLGNIQDEMSDEQDAERLVQYSLKAQSHLKVFSQRLLKKHIGRLEEYIFQSFCQLVNKSSLGGGLVINPEDFSITLMDIDGVEVPPDKLSAGERQLLAIAILWGLQKASHRDIPVVIDTPMGRLDSNHRELLVRRYLPFASHQTVLLSTDEEIVGKYHTALSSFIHNEMNLLFNESSKSSMVEQGCQHR